METICEVQTASAAEKSATNPYRTQINQLLQRGTELVAEVNRVPEEDRQDSIADELNAIAKQIHLLLEQEAAHLKGQNN